MPKPHFLEPLLRRHRSAALRNTRSGRTVASVLETALDSASRNRGLLGRDSLPAGHALIIAPGMLIHTFAMRFNIDILFVARDGRVLKALSSVPARRIAGALGSFAVVELPAEALASSDTRTGDTLEVVISGEV
jgi:uncharacterized membrane protein (UPF0127 family)